MESKYNNQTKLNKKNMIIKLIVILTLILIIALIILMSILSKNAEKEQAILSGRFNSIKDIVEYYECKFKYTKNNNDDEFKTDIYVTFKYNLYDDDKSNEKFFNSIINEIAKFLDYTNFRMIDQSRKDEPIEIKVMCKNNKIDKIIINDIEDYFIYMDSQIDLKEYKELSINDISIDSPELLNCIQNNWSSLTEFGSRETIFQDYYIYFDEGIKTRKIDGKIYNIIFTKNYVNSVINGFTVNTESDIIKSRMGEPTFKNADESIIGYKSNDIYVFFEDNQISIYRNTQEGGYNEFFELVDKFLNNEYSLLEFMNELTYIWPDYEEYTYDTQTVFLSYPNKGIDIKINYDNTDGIIFYNNVGINQEIVSKYLEHTEFVAKLKIDNIYNAEERRFEKERNISNKCNEYKEKFEKDDNRNRGKIYDYYMKMSEDDSIMSVYFISQDNEFANCELNESIDTYIWLNDYCFLYSKLGKGIYYYDLKNHTKGVIVSGDNNEYKIKSYENGVLKYDEESIEVQY